VKLLLAVGTRGGLTVGPVEPNVHGGTAGFSSSIVVN